MSVLQALLQQQQLQQQRRNSMGDSIGGALGAYGKYMKMERMKAAGADILKLGSGLKEEDLKGVFSKHGIKDPQTAMQLVQMASQFKKSFATKSPLSLSGKRANDMVTHPQHKDFIQAAQDKATHIPEAEPFQQTNAGTLNKTTGTLSNLDSAKLVKPQRFNVNGILVDEKGKVIFKNKAAPKAFIVNDKLVDESGKVLYGSDEPGGGVFSGKAMPAQTWNLVYSLKDKVINGTATQKEKEKYKIAEGIITQPRVVTDPISKEQSTIIPTLPSGFPRLSGSLKDRAKAKKENKASAVVLSEALESFEIKQINDPAALSQVEISKYRDALDKMASMEEKLTELKIDVDKNGPQYGTFFWNTDNYKYQNSRYKQALLMYKEVLKLGVLNGPDLPLMEDILENPTSGKAAIADKLGKDLVTPGLKNVLNTLKKERARIIKKNPEMFKDFIVPDTKGGAGTRKPHKYDKYRK